MENNKNIALIEYLRVIGIGLLVFYHIGCMSTGIGFSSKLFILIANRGWLGTDLFLCISGYLFYKSFNFSCDNNVRIYLKRRLFRIIPAYYMFLIFYYLVGLKIEAFADNNFVVVKNYWLYFFTFTANIPMAFGSWSGIALEGLFGLSLLMQLFVVFVLFFSLIKKTINRLIFLLLFQGVAVIIRFCPVFMENEWASYFFTFTRLDSFLWGVLLCILLENMKTKYILYRLRKILISCSVIMILTIVPFTDLLSPENPITAVLGFPVIAIFNFTSLNILLNSRMEPKKSSIDTGDFVYSIYLIKLPAIYLILGLIRKYFPVVSGDIFILYSTLSVFLFLLLFGVLFSWSRTFLRRKKSLLNKFLKSEFLKY